MTSYCCPHCQKAFKAAKSLQCHLKQAVCTREPTAGKNPVKAKAIEPPAPTSSAAEREPATLEELQVKRTPPLFYSRFAYSKSIITN